MQANALLAAKSAGRFAQKIAGVFSVKASESAEFFVFSHLISVVAEIKVVSCCLFD